MSHAVDSFHPCYEFRYNGKFYILDTGWDFDYWNRFLPSLESFRESSALSTFDIDQLADPIVNINGQLFINSSLFPISINLSSIDWSIVDAIFISHVGSYLLLPIILRETDFSGRIYVPQTLHSVVLCCILSRIDRPESLPHFGNPSSEIANRRSFLGYSSISRIFL